MSRAKVKFSFPFYIQGIRDYDLTKKNFWFDSNVEIAWSHAHKEYQGSNDTLVCRINITKWVEGENLNLLQKISKEEDLGFAEDLQVSRAHSIVPKLDGEPYHLPNSQYFPQTFKSLKSDLYDEAKSIIAAVTEKIWWLTGRTGILQTYQSITSSFSFDDGQTWSPMPSSFIFCVARAQQKPRLTDDTWTAIKDKSIELPLHHSIFREAWGLRTQNSRSALIMSMTALETATKWLIAQKGTAVEPYIVEASAPPIFKIFDEIIPRLPYTGFAKDIPKKLTKKCIDEIKKSTLKRNVLIHRGEMLKFSKGIEPWLKLVKNLLYYIDAIAGYDWAWSHVDQEMFE
ncbi:MAG: hypothetical protein JJ975_05830 [Bacteroidia bacterium]|nr:hypothetical protein [Bacteroidia bacterium]